MRGSLCWLSLLLLLTACHEDVIPSPLPAVPEAPPGPAPMATFAADPAGTAPGIQVTATEVLGRDRLRLAVETTWPADHLESADLLVRIDPGARAHIAPMHASWGCGGNVEWYRESDDQWLLHRAPWPNECPCSVPHEPGNFEIARMEVSIGEPGTWRIYVSPASLTPLCDCDQCFDRGMGSYGGTIHVAAP